jgi:hypothetical protein
MRQFRKKERFIWVLAHNGTQHTIFGLIADVKNDLCCLWLMYLYTMIEVFLYRGDKRPLKSSGVHVEYIDDCDRNVSELDEDIYKVHAFS